MDFLSPKMYIAKSCQVFCDVQYMMKWMTNFFFPCHRLHAYGLPLSSGMETPKLLNGEPKKFLRFFFNFCWVIGPLVFSLLLGVENAHMSSHVGACLWVFLVYAAVYILHNVLLREFKHVQTPSSPSWTPQNLLCYTVPVHFQPRLLYLEGSSHAPSTLQTCGYGGERSSDSISKLPQNWAMKNSSPVCSRDCFHNATSILFFFISFDSYCTYSYSLLLQLCIGASWQCQSKNVEMIQWKNNDLFCHATCPSLDHCGLCAARGGGGGVGGNGAGGAGGTGGAKGAGGAGGGGRGGAGSAPSADHSSGKQITQRSLAGRFWRQLGKWLLTKEIVHPLLNLKPTG